MTLANYVSPKCRPPRVTCRADSTALLRYKLLFLTTVASSMLFVKDRMPLPGVVDLAREPALLADMGLKIAAGQRAKELAWADFAFADEALRHDSLSVSDRRACAIL